MRFFAVSLFHRALGLKPPDPPSIRLDAEFGLDTATPIELDQLDILSPNRVHGVLYQPTPEQITLEMLNRLPIRHQEFAFVDLGSGKGLVLLLASEYPFRRIVGVEFSSQLHAIAEQNLRAYSSPTQKCRDITLLCMDAMEFPIPPEPCVFYLFNPFLEPVMRPVLASIEQSLRAVPRQFYLVYYNPSMRILVDASPLFRPIAEDTDYVIYQSTVAPA